MTPVTHRLSIVIPTLNEEKHVGILLRALENQMDMDLDIIVSDGGSEDNTKKVVNDFPGVRFVTGAKGRACQMNLGCEHARFPTLLFLHADSIILDPVLLKRALIVFQQRAFENPSQLLAGHFSLKFKGNKTHQHGLFWRYAEEKTSINRPDTINGDQGLLITKNDFEKIGRFNEEMNFLEDQDIAARIFETGKWIVLPGRLWTSARRFETQGEHRLYILMSIIMGLYKTGHKEFFKAAPKLYSEQKNLDRLRLSSFLILIVHILKNELGLMKSIIAWYKVGRYIRSHSWQMFYFFDQLLRPVYESRTYPLLKFHDVIFERLTNNAICNTIVAVVGFIWFMLILTPYFVIKDRFYFSKSENLSP